MFEPWQALDDVYKEDRVAHERSPGVCDVQIVGKQLESGYAPMGPDGQRGLIEEGTAYLRRKSFRVVSYERVRSHGKFKNVTVSIL